MRAALPTLLHAVAESKLTSLGLAGARLDVAQVESLAEALPGLPLVALDLLRTPVNNFE